MPDGGAAHFAQTVKLLKQKCPHIYVECLTSDYQGDLNSVAIMANSGMDVYAHNLETVCLFHLLVAISTLQVRDLTPYVRDRRATYDQSLSVLAHVKAVQPNLVTKSSLMLGLGERDYEVSHFNSFMCV